MTTTPERTSDIDLSTADHERAIELCRSAWEMSMTPGRWRTARKHLAELRDLLGRPSVEDLLRRQVRTSGVIGPGDQLFIYGVANGLTNVEISEALGGWLDPDQVGHRIRTIREAVGAANNAHLVAIAAGRGQLWL